MSAHTHKKNLWNSKTPMTGPWVLPTPSSYFLLTLFQPCQPPCCLFSVPDLCTCCRLLPSTLPLMSAWLPLSSPSVLDLPSDFVSQILCLKVECPSSLLSIYIIPSHLLTCILIVYFVPLTSLLDCKLHKGRNWLLWSITECLTSAAILWELIAKLHLGEYLARLGRIHLCTECNSFFCTLECITIIWFF